MIWLLSVLLTKKCWCLLCTPLLFDCTQIHRIAAKIICFLQGCFIFTLSLEMGDIELDVKKNNHLRLQIRWENVNLQAGMGLSQSLWEARVTSMIRSCLWYINVYIHEIRKLSPQIQITKIITEVDLIEAVLQHGHQS